MKPYKLPRIDGTIPEQVVAIKTALTQLVNQLNMSDDSENASVIYSKSEDLTRYTKKETDKLLEEYDVAKDIGDYIVESGSIAATSSGVTGTWYYEKLASGVAKCWGKFSRSAVAVNNAVGSSGWYRSAVLGDHYPRNLFTAVTFADVKPAYWSSGSILDSQIYTIDGAAQVQWVARHTVSNASMNFSYTINVIGTWK